MLLIKHNHVEALGNEWLSAILVLAAIVCILIAFTDNIPLKAIAVAYVLLP